MPKVIYIAGPFRGSNPWVVEQNIRKAEQWGFAVCEHGHIAMIPHTMYRFFDKTLPDSFWLAAGLRLLDACDALVAIPGHERSQGALAEITRAKGKGMPTLLLQEHPLSLARLEFFCEDLPR